ncbi:uncharacterized protein GGS22DRAFT_195377 [Annulohypoxylon maeteangense]|uniref:uncharacterized protein n=1 Tax=Annulohypoxylon maeteangense TaxID=1927788 RepID=UPI002007D4C3|nr:uncharacterized protein GGS22DRAFT_195377 [Annulohypoxylon maeteangense]KAI0883137.1 hypothetical protein GGS22DRAFT_195377 [Annulohypoxylon maeteangense]
MRSSSLYSAALLLAHVSPGYSVPKTVPNRETIHKEETSFNTNVDTIIVKSIITEEIREREYDGVKVEIIKKDIFSPSIVVDMLDSFANLVQSPAIRLNHELREAKAESLELVRGQTFGDWWARRRWDSLPSGSEWFDGTLAEGMLFSIEEAVYDYVPQMFALDRHLNLMDAGSLSNRRQEEVYLKEDAESATNALKAVIRSQGGDLHNGVGRVASMLVARARRFAQNLEEFNEIVAQVVQRSASWSAQGGSLKRESATEKVVNNILSRMGQSVFAPNRNAIRTSPRQRAFADDSELDEKFLRLYTRYVLNFLEDDDENTNGATALQTIKETYGNFRKGLGESQKVYRGAKKVMVDTRSMLERKRQHEATDAYKYARYAVDEMEKNLDRILYINGFGQKLVANGTKLTQDMDTFNARRIEEIEAIEARSKGLEPQDDGQPPKRSKQMQARHPITGIPFTTEYFYEYQIRAPWRMVKDIRAAADRLEYVWSTLLWCEDELAYLNICEAVNFEPEERREALGKRFRRPEGPKNEDSPPCDSFSNPYIMKHMCKDDYTL